MKIEVVSVNDEDNTYTLRATEENQMALFYIYKFMYAAKEVFFYAASEEDARKQFAETFGIQAGELLQRRNW